MVMYTLLLSNMQDILLLDGLCALCSRSGSFLTKRLSGPLTLSELQSEEGVALLEKHEITEDSVVLIRNGKPYIRSAAAIRCLLYMKWNWRWMFPFAWIIPLPIRDLGYRFIAKIRHKFN